MSSTIFQLLTMLILFNILEIANQQCLARRARIRSIMRGHQTDVLQQRKGALISSRISNGFQGGNNGSCLRDTIYTLSGYTQSSLGQSIKFDLLQQYELNTLKIWFWDGDNRIYNKIRIYILLGNSETQIYDSFAKSVFTIQFPDQKVQGFRIYYTKCFREYR